MTDGEIKKTQHRQIEFSDRSVRVLSLTRLTSGKFHKHSDWHEVVVVFYFKFIIHKIKWAYAVRHYIFIAEILLYSQCGRPITEKNIP